jgi:hypothetical protein
VLRVHDLDRDRNGEEDEADRLDDHEPRQQPVPADVGEAVEQPAQRGFRRRTSFRERRDRQAEGDRGE